MLRKHMKQTRILWSTFIDAHLVELLEYFGLEDHLSLPTKTYLQSFNHLRSDCSGCLTYLDRLWTKWYGPSTKTLHAVMLKVGKIFFLKINELKICMTIMYASIYFIVIFFLTEDGKFIALRVKLANGKEVNLSPRLPDIDLLDVCKTPDQNRLIRLLKHSMTVFKSKSNNSKYALEIHRFLIQQTCTLSEKEAAGIVQGMFVNTSGKTDGHIPADLQMEYVVKTIKNTLNICIQINRKTTLQSILKAFLEYVIYPMTLTLPLVWLSGPRNSPLKTQQGMK